MIFNSIAFLIFATCFFLLWPYVRKTSTSRWSFLIVASSVFYGWWDYRYLALILISGLIDFLAAMAIHAIPNRKKFFLILSLTGNLGLLFAFKYISFAAKNVDMALTTFGYHPLLVQGIPDFMLVLPIGISFYTFQSMSYTIDVYRGQIQPTRHILHFFAYLALFPQLVAGPILRAKDLLPQLCHDRPVTPADKWAGLQRIAYGYFKKVVIADNLAPIVAMGFKTSPAEASGLFWWYMTIAFAIQIYGDFSGYSDIARGLARWMGYDFSENFNHPYTASSLRDFWNRWHISLSTWFRDYLYLPLGGSRCGNVRGYINLWITMLLSGLWHGAAWTFIAWGVVHAGFLTLERWTSWPKHLQKFPFGRSLSTLIVLIQVCIGWVFFRSESLEQAQAILTAMLHFSGGLSLGFGKTIDLNNFFITLLVMLPIMIREWMVYTGWFKPSLFPVAMIRIASPIWIGLILAAILYFRGDGHEFIYFQF
ncbi:MAG: hypothetical protein H7832_04135 [Magnetococcus sp. DMHC-6]